MLKEFCEKENIYVVFNSIKEREDKQNFGSELSSHFRFSLYRGNRLFISGDYTKGFGYAERWVKNYSKKYRKSMSEKEILVIYNNYCSPLQQTLRKHKIDNISDSYYKELVDKYQHKDQLQVEEVFASLLYETIDSDEDFDFWVSLFGYDEDSYKARKMYEHVQETSRILRREFGCKLLQELVDIANEM